MKTIGWILVILAGIVIFYNVSVVPRYNEYQVQEHPFKTIFSGGSNLKKGYTFRPPFTGFEVVVVASALAGLVMIIISTAHDQAKGP